MHRSGERHRGGQRRALVLACDLVVMADNARLIEVFVRRGIIPDAGGAYLLPRLVGLPKAKEIMFFGDDLRAADAGGSGSPTGSCRLAELDAAVTAGPSAWPPARPRRIAMTKWLLNRRESSRQTAFEEEASRRRS